MGRGIYVSPESMEQLIEYVRQHPCLYDPTLPDHKDAQKIANIWTRITTKLGVKNMTADHWKKRWRGQRDTYVRKRREIKSKKSGQAAVKARKWKYIEVMSFLDTYIEENDTEGNLSMQEEDVESQESQLNDPEDTESEGTQSLVEDQDSSKETDPMDITAPSTPTTSSTPIPKQKKHTVSNAGKRKRKADDDGILGKILEEQKRRKEERDKVMQELVRHQPEDYFFQHVASRARELPQNIRSVFEIQIQQLLYNAQNPHLPPQPIMPLPYVPQVQTANFSQPCTSYQPDNNIPPHPNQSSQQFIFNPQPSTSTGSTSQVIGNAFTHLLNN